MRDERGFTLVEFMIAAAIMTAVLGGTVMLASQMQQAYSTQLDDATVEEEVRFSLDWIAQALRNAGSNPYTISPFTPIDVSADGESITLLADINPPDGLTTGENENVTIAFDAGAMAITRDDNSAVGDPEVMTEPVISGLLFTLFDSAGNALVDGQEGLATFVHVRVTGQSQAFNTFLGEGRTMTLETEVRVRTRP